MSHVAIIPARAGSKSIINKNLQKLGGKTLVQMAVDSALDAGIFSKIIISTDIPVVLEEYANNPKLTVLERQADLCTDQALMSNTVMDALHRSEIPSSYYFWLLQPTSPFREKSDFIEIERLLFKHKPNSLISVKDVGGAHPDRCYTEVRGLLKPLKYTNFENKQQLKPVYLRNGCFYVCQVGVFRKMREFYLDPCTAYQMPEKRSVNIDGPLDLALARVLSKAGKNE